MSNHHTVVLYHGPNCPDGFASALIARMALGSDGVLFRPVQYGQPIPDEAYKARAVYILDFSYPKAQLDELANKVENLHVLDHHKSAQEELKECPYAKFDMNKSGAVMTWEYFYFEREAPLFFRYIQDRDLWKWELPMSREFSAALSIIPYDFNAWGECYWNFTHSPTVDFANEFFRNGRAILSYQHALVEKMTARPLLVSLGGHKGIPFVNTPILQSEVGERLCELFPEAPFSATWYSNGMSEIYSLRSRGGFDVSEVAKGYGGGGNATAAGFVVKPSGWPSMTWSKDRPPEREEGMEGVEGEEGSKTGDGP